MMRTFIYQRIQINSRSWKLYPAAQTMGNFFLTFSLCHKGETNCLLDVGIPQKSFGCIVQNKDSCRPTNPNNINHQSPSWAIRRKSQVNQMINRARIHVAKKKREPEFHNWNPKTKIIICFTSKKKNHNLFHPSRANYTAAARAERDAGGGKRTRRVDRAVKPRFGSHRQSWEAVAMHNKASKESEMPANHWAEPDPLLWAWMKISPRQIPG